MDFSSPSRHRVLLNLLWFTGLPCKRLLTRCSWKSLDVPCDELFHLLPTDIGFCCSFNHDPLTDMLRGSHFAEVIALTEDRYGQWYAEL